MSTGHRILTDLGKAYGPGGNSTITDPGSGGTVDLNGKTLGVLTCSGGTRTLPAGAQAGTAVWVVAEADSTISGKSVRSGKAALFVKDATGWEMVANSSATSAEGTISIPLMSITGEDGTVLAKQASTTSGWSQLSNKNVVLNIPVNATNEAFSFSVSAPSDMDGTQPIYVDVHMSKSADNDTLTMDCELYSNGAESGWTADLVTSAAQSIFDDGSPATFTCDAPVYSSTLAGVLTLGGTNDGDAVYIHGVRIRYTKV